MNAALLGLVAVLPFAAGDNGLPYAIAPTAAQRFRLADRLVAGLRGPEPVVRGARACDDAACARRAGAALGASRVVFGSATRYMALIWGADAAIVDVRSGRVDGPYAIGYKGDYDALREGIGDLAAALSRRLAGDRRDAGVRREPSLRWSTSANTASR